jgi:hypothetical protein
MGTLRLSAFGMSPASLNQQQLLLRPGELCVVAT